MNGSSCLSRVTVRSLRKSSSTDVPSLGPVATTTEQEEEREHLEAREERASQQLTLPLGSIFEEKSTPKAKSSSHPTSSLESSYETSEEITVTGRDAPKPFIHFSDYEWPEEISKVLRQSNFSYPTPIQSQGLPIALEGRDMVGIAQTGSGKTLSYIMPMVVKGLSEEVKNSRNPFALVLAPTRELAQQIHSVARQFPSLRSVCLYGGSAKDRQIAELQRGARLLVATPGRLNDLLNGRYTSVKDISFLVLDEADRMLDMGFEPQIRQIIQDIPQNRQTLMWSATWPEDVRELALDFLNDFIQVNIGSSDLHANHNIKQVIKILTETEKSSELIKTLEDIRDQCRQKDSDSMDKILIFASTKRRVDAIVSGLRRRQFRAEGTHGDKSQSQRENTLRAYRTGRIDILVATDVAARGLDVNDIKAVINYDYPNTSEDYVHRIGRTARAGNKGTAYTFFTPDDCSQARDLISVMKEAGQEVPSKLHDLVQMAIQEKRMKKSFRESSKSKPWESRDNFNRLGNRFGESRNMISQRRGGFYNRPRGVSPYSERREEEDDVYRQDYSGERQRTPSSKYASYRNVYEDDEGFDEAEEYSKVRRDRGPKKW